jgi:hypothetical protein
MTQKAFTLLVLVTLLAVPVVVSLMVPVQSVDVYAQDESALTSLLVEEAPTLDGVGDEAFWADAAPVEVSVKKGANESNTTVILKSVYTEDSVYFLVTWADPTESFIRSPWEMQADGSWVQLKDPDDKGGDNNLWYEDKLAFIWPINNSIPEFEEDGCYTACHDGENEDVKPFGNKYTEEEGQMGDIWHWKSVRNLNQVHDQYVDSTRYSEETKEAGRHSDPSESGGYKNNITEDKSGPAFMFGGEDFPRDGSPGAILESEAVPFDPAVFEVGDRVPGIIKSEFVGDAGDIAAGWKWEDGMWTLEFGRKLVTGSEFDVQFEDLSATYYFGVAVFDNAQVRHAYHKNPAVFVFGQ